MARLFGTDGIRGKANQEPMTPEMALRIGKAAALVFKKKGSRPRILIGKDTRLSGYIFESALTSGICSMGGDVFLVGPMPTPAIAHLTRSLTVDASIMISASHNPADDNGIKFFSSKGIKIDRDVEEEIEKHIFSASLPSSHIAPDQIGKAYRIDDAPGRYIEFAKSTIQSADLSGITAVVDCANGAAYSIAPQILRELGVNVHVINNNPNGLNINHKSGSLHLETVASTVRKLKADIGISFDGDADRCLFVDEKGELFDGDHVIALVSRRLKKQGQLPHHSIVATVMSNFALDQWCRSEGITLIKTDVGDKNVHDAMAAKGIVIGGEQAGHTIFITYNPTSDGIISCLHVLREMKESAKKLSVLRPFKLLPHVTTNIEVNTKKDFTQVKDVALLIKQLESKHKGKISILIRCSGTQALCRVTVQGPTLSVVKHAAASLSQAIKKNR